MADFLQRVRQFFDELQRRNVYRVGVTYAVVAFVVIQVADITFVRLGLPAWTVTFVIVLSALGFPLAVVLAWAFEMTPEGVRRTSPERDPGAGRDPRDDAREAGGGAPSSGQETVEVQTPRPGTRKLMSAGLEVVDGDARVDRIQFFETEDGGTPTFTFGRQDRRSATHVQLEHPTVSREHAAIRLGEGAPVIQNRSTTNPTSVNGTVLREEGSSTRLADGDVIEMGKLTFRYREW